MGTESNPKCDKFIGGLWLPVRNSRVYHLVKCNLSAGHLPGNCAFVDPDGGTVVTAISVSGNRSVNERGWVTEIAEG